MKILINKLPATSKGKQDKLMIVEKEYLRVLYANANDPGCRLKMTNKRFIQMYERKLNRSLEGNTAVNETDDQADLMQDLSANLKKTADLTASVVTPESSQRTDLAPAELMSSIPHNTVSSSKRKAHNNSQETSTKNLPVDF